MYAETRKGTTRRMYVTYVRKLLKEVFGLTDQEMHKENKAWGDWHTLTNPANYDLWHFLESGEYRDSFKARAVSIMMTQDATWMPFVWEGGVAVNRLRSVGLGRVLFVDTKKPLATFTLALLQYVTDILPSDAPRDAKMLHACLAYDTLILDALGVLSEDDPRARALCERYVLAHTISGNVLHEFNSRSPLYNFFCAEIPETWKHQVDARMRDIICDKRNPPTVQAQASALYAKCVLRCHSGGHRFPYSSDLLASQIGFILEHANLEGLYGHNGVYVKSLLERLSGNEYKDLLQRFVCSLVLGDDRNAGVFRVKSTVALEAAKYMLNRFGRENEQLRKRLRALIAKHKADCKAERAAEAANAKKNTAYTARLEAVLAKMR